MKKLLMIIFVISLGISVAGSAGATLFTDNFYGTGSDGSYVEIWEGNKVTLNFNILDASFTTDMTIESGLLDFVFSGADCSDETVKVRAGYYDGNTLLKSVDYDLGYWSWKSWSYVRQYATLQIDLGLEGLLPYLQDGLFTSIVISPRMLGDNDIRLDAATLSVEASAAPVPEPATMLLLGLGFVGLAGYSRKKIT